MFPAGEPGIRTRRVSLAGGVSLRVAESGESGAPPVLLLHGWGASLYMWRDWFAPLAAAGLRAIAVDLPGHGLSDKPDDPASYRLESLVAVLRELLDVERLEAVVVVAQSMAGTVALELVLAGEPRIAKLALVNPACFGRIRLQALGRLVSPPAVDLLLPRLVTRWVVARAHRLVYGDPALITERDEDEYWAPSQFPSYARAMRMLLHEFNWNRPPVDVMAARLRGMRGRALVVLGTRDRLVRDSRGYVAALQATEAPLDVHEVRGGGHAVNEERPDEVILRFLTYLKNDSTAMGQHRAM
ncbi:MAG TPA: alpha/beta fold hydrolase [Gemmatimonadaceae bacterium]|nr:alpha/beta fold hydrolase [Gemmatimonadaceae bacterium]